MADDKEKEEKVKTDTERYDEGFDAALKEFKRLIEAKNTNEEEEE